MAPDPGFGGFDPRAFENVPLFRELAKLMSWQGGPVNWDLARQVAGGLAGDARPQLGTDRATVELQQAVRVAELWLDAVTSLAAVEGPVMALSPSEWAGQAADSGGLGRYVEPVARGMEQALGRGMPAEAAALGGALQGAMRPLGAMMAGMQAGTVAGHLAGQLLGTYDLGVPTLDPRTIGTVGDAAERFAEDYGFERVELVHWLALREALHRRMYAGVPWLAPHVSSLVGRFAEAADLDPSRIIEQLGGMGLRPESLTDLGSVEELMAGAEALSVEPTPEQRTVLERLQALVSFIEGYSDVVLRRAADGKLPSLARIAEAAIRRRAEKGAGERFLEQLVGLDLKPSDVRQGARFCDAVVEARGVDGLDRVWAGAELLPTAAELVEPSRWLVRMAARDLDGPAPDGSPST